MSWLLLLRTLYAMLALVGGGAAGWIVGGWVGAPVVLASIGAAIAIAVLSVTDGLRLNRLLDWLRDPDPALRPSDPGLWGETAYRIDRLLQQQRSAVAIEARQLEQFLSAIEASPNGVLLLGPDCIIDWCNSVSADHFGLNPVRDRGQRLTHLVRAPAFVAYLQQRQFGQPAAVASPDGRATLSVQAREFGADRLLVLSTDVTERERAEAMRRDFVANVSHEIRTPLTVLAGFVETLATLPLTEVERKRVLVLMEQQTDRMQVLVGDLLQLAQLEGSPRPPVDRWLPLAGLVKRLEAEALALSAGRHRIQVHGEAGWELAGADAEMYSAIGNLLSNAVRYTPIGGSIELRCVERADGALVVSVTDDGVGVAREHLPRLTERFYRVDGSRSRETGGTGLGLSIVKHVMQRHGGSIEIESEPGKGSRFILVFPAARVRRAEAAAAVVMAPIAATPT